MAAFVFKNAELLVNSNDLRCFARSVTVNMEVETPDATTICDDTRIRLPGLNSWQIDVEFNTDFDTGGPDHKLFQLLGTGPFTVSVKKDKDSAISFANPKFRGQAIPSSYNPIGGSVGEVSVNGVSFLSSGTLVKLVA